jgi:large subunit ribosomal protein L35e
MRMLPNDSYLSRVHYNEQLREKYAGEKSIPRDLRQKKTRAIRQRLTTEQKNKKTAKAAKKAANFPQRKFAVKAL